MSEELKGFESKLKFYNSLFNLINMFCCLFTRFVFNCCINYVEKQLQKTVSLFLSALVTVILPINTWSWINIPVPKCSPHPIPTHNFSLKSEGNDR